MPALSSSIRNLLRRLATPVAIVVLPATLALGLRLRGLGRESLWLDEGYSWSRSRMPLSELIADAIGAHHNPTYFVFLRYWQLLGDDEFMLRLPSALTGTLAAVAGAVLGLILAGPGAGLTAGVLLALSPLQVRFGQEARMYAPLCLFATLALCGLLWLGAQPTAAARPLPGTLWLRRGWLAPPPGDPASDDGRGAAMAWTAYVIGLLGAVYMHNTAAVFALALGVAALLLALRPFRLRLGFLINFAAANLIVLLGWAPYLRTELTQAQRFSESYFWTKFPTEQDLINSAREIYLLTADVDSALAALLLSAAAIGLWSLRKRPELLAATLWLAIAGPLLVWLVSFYKPIYGTRLLLWAAPPFFALVGAGVAALRHWIWPSIFCLAVGWLVQPQLELDYLLRTNEPWREVVWTVRPRVVPGARILTATREEAMMLDYYMHRRSHPLLEVPVEVARKRNAWKQARDAPRVWLVDRKSGKRFARAEAELRARGSVVWDRSWNKVVRVIEFDLGSEPR